MNGKSRTVTVVGKNIERMRQKRGFTKKDLCLRAGIGTTTLNQIYTNPKRDTGKLDDIAAALGCSTAELHKEVYQLTNAPICTSEYHLELEDSAVLAIPNIPNGPVTVLVVPIEPEQLMYPCRLLYRYDSDPTARVIENTRLGDRFVRIPVGTHGSLPDELLPSSENGEYLGAIADISSLPHIFFRHY